MKRVFVNNWAYLAVFIMAVGFLWFIGSPIKISSFEQSVDGIEETKEYCLRKGAVGRFSGLVGGFCCESLVPVSLKGTDKFVCKKPRVAEVKSKFIDNYHISKLDDRREVEGGIFLEVSRNVEFLEGESKFLISSARKRARRHKRNKREKKISSEVRSKAFECRKQALSLLGRISEGKELKQRQKNRLNGCYRYIRNHRRLSKNRSWSGWNHIAIVSVSLKGGDKYLVKYEDASGKCIEEYMLNEGSKTIRVEYVDYSKKSGIRGYCDEESELKEFEVKGSSQYVVHEIGEFGQNLLELDGPVSVDDIFARPVISIREPSIYARVAQPTTTPSPSPSPSPQHKECFSVTSQSFSCDLVAGAGADECTDDSNCGPNATHKECSGESCGTVIGSGVDECTTDLNCGDRGIHKECSGESCGTVIGSGTDECSRDENCKYTNPRHKECSGESCVDVDGSGRDECSNDSSCQYNSTHKECSGKSCVSVIGSGTDECTRDENCSSNPTHKECNGESCVSASGSGTDECSRDENCKYTNPHHKECLNYRCVTLGSPGPDECDRDENCKYTNPQHKECSGGACSLVSGPGRDECTRDENCSSSPTHKECSGESCVSVSGSGTDECTRDRNCNLIPVHKGCISNECVSLQGAGSDECSRDENCKSTSTHNECSGGSCVSVSGSGSDECTKDENCGSVSSHKECDGDVCISVNGEGRDECSKDENCGFVSSYKVCRTRVEGVVCTSASGEGADECDDDGDC